jgi:hypothetical protein
MAEEERDSLAPRMFFSSLFLFTVPNSQAGELPESNPGSAPSASSTYATRLQAAWLAPRMIRRACCILHLINELETQYEISSFTWI